MPTHPEPTDRAEVTKLALAVEEALAEALPTRHRDDSPVPAIGTAPPVPQPGIPPMSARTTEVARAVMFCSLATVPPGLIAVAVMVASEHANPIVIGMICAAPAALAVPILAISSLLRRGKEVIQAAPPEHHHHYSGPVHQDQRNVTSHSSWLGKTTNNL